MFNKVLHVQQVRKFGNTYFLWHQHQPHRSFTFLKHLTTSVLLRLRVKGFKLLSLIVTIFIYACLCKHGSNSTNSKTTRESSHYTTMQFSKEVVAEHSASSKIENILHDSKKTAANYFSSNWFEEEEIIKRTEDCEEYFQNVPVFAMNKDIIKYEDVHVDPFISLAFSHMLHTQVAIYETFLAMYFRSSNFYCIHVDRKAQDIVRQAVEGLVKCYSTKIGTGKIFLLDKEESIKVMKMLCLFRMRQ